jgi:hypothetical protein
MTKIMCLSLVKPPALSWMLQGEVYGEWQLGARIQMSNGVEDVEFLATSGWGPMKDVFN